MYLKSIELSGFKSFAKKNIFEFNTPISAIVGPNGSGKSNVAEAFRFVLGEQSIKSMRGKRGEDLIWNGSTSEPRANRASVKVTFDNTKKIFDIDFPEVILERVVHRDGENVYLINGSQVRLKDVIELLAKAHIGASGHHIISQGEADKVVSANPRDRKAMVEDALGLKLYQYKRIESEKKLKKTFENIAQVEALRKEIAPHLRFLQKQVDKLEKTESLREDLIKISQEYFKREEFYLKETKLSLENERSPLEVALKKLENELAEAKKTLALAGEKEKKEYLILELEKELSGARALKDAASRELGKVEGLIDAQERIVRKQQELATSDEHKLVSLKDVESLYKEIENEEDGPGVLGRVKERFLNFLKERRETASSGIIAEAKIAINELLEERGKVEEKLTDAKKKETKLETDYENLKKDVEKAKDSDNSAQIAVFRIMSEENEVRSKLNILQVREEKVGLEEAEFKRTLEEVALLAGQEILRYKEFSLSPEEMKGEPREKQDERKRTLERNKLRLEDSNMAGSEEVKKEHQETSERDAFLARELLDLERSAETLKELIKDLEERLATEFKTGLENINKHFDKLFTTMFGGGEAELVLVKEKGRTLSIDSQGSTLEIDEEAEDLDEESKEEGLEIKVSLPQKKIHGLMMLSGGERALTSIALIFAISQVNPPPFIILDETDAALDESNSKKYGDMVEMLSKHSQLILITHNRETMSRAGVIYGVTMSGNGVSKLLSISFDQAVEVAK
jgi:chromosome segregation protein